MKMRQVNIGAGVREGNLPNAADVAVIWGIRLRISVDGVGIIVEARNRSEHATCL